MTVIASIRKKSINAERVFIIILVPELLDQTRFGADARIHHQVNFPAAHFRRGHHRFVVVQIKFVFIVGAVGRIRSANLVKNHAAVVGNNVVVIGGPAAVSRSKRLACCEDCRRPTEIRWRW